MTDDPVAVLDELIEAARKHLDGLVALRSTMTSEPEPNTDDFAPENVITASTAAHRFGISKPTIRRWVKEYSIGFKRGGRLYVSVPRLRAHLGDSVA